MFVWYRMRFFLRLGQITVIYYVLDLEKIFSYFLFDAGRYETAGAPCRIHASTESSLLTNEGGVMPPSPNFRTTFPYANPGPGGRQLAVFSAAVASYPAETGHKTILLRSELEPVKTADLWHRARDHRFVGSPETPRQKCGIARIRFCDDDPNPKQAVLRREACQVTTSAPQIKREGGRRASLI